MDYARLSQYDTRPTKSPCQPQIRRLAGTKLYFVMAEKHMCEQLA